MKKTINDPLFGTITINAQKVKRFFQKIRKWGKRAINV